MRSIDDRMGEALRLLNERWNGKRSPKAFYLIGPDFDAFMAQARPRALFQWGNNPVIEREEPTFHGVPVRKSTSTGRSRLYDHRSAGRYIPE